MKNKLAKATSYVERKDPETVIELLKKTITSVAQGTTVFEFSEKHKVLGVFIKWFGCPVCQEVIESVGRMFPTLIKLNTIPIIFHQEDNQDATNYFLKSTDINVKYLPYCKVTKELQQQIGIGSASMGSHCEALIKGNMLGLVLGPKRRSLTIPTKVINPFSQFGVVSIEKGFVKKKVVYSTLHKRLDFGLFLNDVGSNLISSKYVQELINQFPKVVATNNEMKTENLRISSKFVKKDSKYEISEDSEIEQTLADEVGRFYLKSYATNEYSVENILIYEEVVNFKLMPLQKDFKIQNQIDKAQEIFQNFLTPHSIMELNIRNEPSMKYKKKIDSIDKEDEKQDLTKLFDELMKEVRIGILSDTFFRFKKSRYYEEYLNSKNGENTILYLI